MSVAALVLAGFAVYTVSGKTDELSGATTYLTSIRWPWLAAAAGGEALSYLAFAGMQRRLLRAGDVEVGLAAMSGITLAGNAIQNTLPAGAVLSAAYSFRLFRRYGADDILAGWTLVTILLVSFSTLAAIASVGLALAVGSASALDLVAVILGVAAVAAGLVLAWTRRDVWLPRAALAVRLAQRVTGRPAGDPDVLVAGWIARLDAFRPDRRTWLACILLGSGNWVGDLACLALAFLAIGAGVPWRGLILAYGAGQLASLLPVTPGGLGVVEGSLTVALVAFGGGEASTVAGVLVYRLLSFWILLPVGWGAWGVLAVDGRRRARAVPLAAMTGPATIGPATTGPAT
jgi:uncharacterized membrane protein YbhN (UPF0104 family)